MYYQLEVTTRCNFDCYYCAGRGMPQRDMSWATFESIVDRIHTLGVTVSLQGEGEPSLHPQFFEMAQYLLKRELKPYTILNGSRMDIEQLDAWFPSFGISVDTLDDVWARQIGRHNLAKVRQHIDDLLTIVDPGRITIMTVDMGQPLEELRGWVKINKFGRHIIQPLSPKADYAKRYTVPIVWTNASPPQPKTCQFLEKKLARFYTWDGIELPCVFIKDTTDFTTMDQLRASLIQGEHKSCCHGCQHLRAITA
jgi:MoaA/NifB/PqqE/SkfB family radical SAM enzyme